MFNSQSCGFSVPIYYTDKFAWPEAPAIYDRNQIESMLMQLGVTEAAPLTRVREFFYAQQAWLLDYAEKAPGFPGLENTRFAGIRDLSPQVAVDPVEQPVEVIAIDRQTSFVDAAPEDDALALDERDDFNPGDIGKVDEHRPGAGRDLEVGGIVDLEKGGTAHPVITSEAGPVSQEPEVEP